jgi:DNA-binding CsgD family transcriptional regulator
MPGNHRQHDEDLQALLHSVYSTLEGAEAWGEVVPRVARWLGADSALLFTPWEAEPQKAFGISHNIPEERLRDYAVYYHARDVWKDAAERRGLVAAGRLFRSDQVLPVRDMMRSEIYADLWRPLDIGHMICALLTDERHESVTASIALSLFRRLDKGGFTDAEARRSDILTPHIRRALLAGKRLEAARGLLEAYETSLRASGEVILLLAPGMTVLHASGEPPGTFGTAGVLQIVQCKLTANDAGTRKQLELAVRDAAAGRPSGAIRARGSDGLEVEISALPLRRRQVLVRVRTLRRSPAEGVARVGEAHRLTEAERRVLALLAEGASVADIAAHLSIRPLTVRTHLANLFEKTGQRSQRELIALVWRNL